MARKFGPGIWAVGIFLLLAASFSFAAYVPDEILVKFKTPIVSLSQGTIVTSSVSVKNAFNTLNVQKTERVFPDEPAPAGVIRKRSLSGVVRPNLALIYKLTLAKNSDIAFAVNELKKLPEVEYAEPNYIIKALISPNDTYYSSQWGLAKISAEAAWDATVGTSDVVAAVVDTGISYSHEDLVGKVVLQKNIITGSNSALDDNGHGTHLAGIIGALTNNSKGIAGINWNVKLMAVKVLDSTGQGTSSDVASGISWAGSHGADVINMSFGDYSDNQTIKNSVIDAYSNGSILVAAAGNEDTSTPIYPAAYTQYVMAVAATDQTDLRSDWGYNSQGERAASNYGTWIDVCAPGTSILSTWLNNTYASKNGTSMATPHVAGLASLILSQNQALTQSDVRYRIETSCDSIDSLNPGFEGLLGHGRINAARALGFPTTAITYPTSGIYVSGQINITGTTSSTNLSKYQIFIGTGNPATLYETLFESATEVINGTLYALNTSYKPDGLYTLKLLCQSATPLTSESTVVFSIDNEYPQVNITSPSDNSTVEGTIQIEGTASDTHLSYYTLSYAKNGSSDFVVISTSSSRPATSVLGTWNTTGLSGIYQLKLSAYDVANHSSSKTITLNISKESTAPSNIPGLIKSIPNPFNPQIQGFTYLSYALQDNFPTILYIFSMSGELIYTKSFSSGDVGGKAGDNLVPWDGKNSSGNFVGNGVYFYKIAASVSGSKKVLGSGRVIIIKN